jgi:hypothetical protein
LSVLNPAYAAAPSNDNWQAATSISGGDVPYTGSIDTTEATKDAVTPPTRYGAHSVWYHMQFANDRQLLMKVQANYQYSSLRLYSAAKATDTPDTWTLVKADRYYESPSTVGLVARLKGGANYYLMVSTYRGYPGGTATLNVRAPAHLTYSMAALGKFAKVDGSAVVHGTLTSTRPASVQIYMQLRQAVGDHVVRGSAEKVFQLTNTNATPWSLRISAGRPFKAGRALITANNLQLRDSGVFVGEYHFARTSVTLK